ncbi:thermolysin [Striga asiatica]|uniref:Thermolysin n=1 Tax=Striga asiatica TaxID=4170 RepID=A0A5A7QHI9_STRAF|nr:thermolysin [Striga asiatica]
MNRKKLGTVVKGISKDLTPLPSGKQRQKKSGRGRPTASLIASVRTAVISTEKSRPAEYRNSPNGNGVIFQRVLQVSHHVFTNKPMKWLYDIQNGHYHHKKEKNKPIVHMKPGYLSTMGSYCVRA